MIVSIAIIMVVVMTISIDIMIIVTNNMIVYNINRTYIYIDACPFPIADWTRLPIGKEGAWPWGGGGIYVLSFISAV